MERSRVKVKGYSSPKEMARERRLCLSGIRKAKGRDPGGIPHMERDQGVTPHMERAQGDIPPTARDRDTSKKALEKDIQQYSTEHAMVVESKDIPKEDAQNWERDSKGIVIRAV